MSEQKELELSGAASALKYIEERERKLRDALDSAENHIAELLAIKDNPPPELDGEDFDVLIARAKAERKDAEDSYYKAQKALREYDKQVDTDRRDVSESITRNEAEKFFFSFAICMRGAVEQIATRQAQEAMECKSPEDMFKLVSPLLRECFSSALKSAADECQVPQWVKSAIENAL